MWSTLRAAATGSTDEGNRPEADPRNSQKEAEEDVDTLLSDDLDDLLDLNPTPAVNSADSNAGYVEDFLGMVHSEDTTVPMSNQTSLFDDDIDDDYIPPGLADFVQQANKRLQEGQSEFMQASSISPDIQGEVESPAGSPKHKIHEDDEDHQLKGEVLGRLGVSSVASVSRKNRPPEDNVLMSPDLLLTPPPNPTFGITDSQAKQRAFEGSTPFVTGTKTATKSFAARLDEEKQQEPPVPQDDSQQKPQKFPDQLELMQLISETIPQGSSEKGSSPERMENSSTPSSMPSESSSNMAVAQEFIPHLGEVKDESLEEMEVAPELIPDLGEEKDEAKDEEKDESLEEIEVQLLAPPKTRTATKVASSAPVPEQVTTAETASFHDPSPLPSPMAPARAPKKEAAIDSQILSKTLPSPQPAAAAATNRSTRRSRPSRRVAAAAATTPSPLGASPSSRASSAKKASSWGSSWGTPLSRGSAAAKTPASKEAAATPSSLGSGTTYTAESLGRLSRPTSASASKHATAPAPEDKPSPPPPRASPPPAFFDRLSRPTAASAAKSSPIHSSVSTPLSGAASLSSAAISPRSGSRTTMTSKATESLDRLSRPTRASASKQATTPASEDKPSPQASPTQAFFDRLSRPTIATAAKSSPVHCTLPIHSSVSTPPSGGASVSSLGSGPRTMTSKATESLDRLSRPTSASASKQATTPASEDKPSPQAPRASPPPSFVDRLSRPTATSAVKSPQVESSVGTKPSAAASVSTAVSPASKEAAATPSSLGSGSIKTTESLDRLSRPTSASASKQATAPASGDKPSPQPPRASPPPSFVDRLSRPTAASAVKSPQVQSSVSTKPTAGASVSRPPAVSSVRTATASTRRTPPVTKSAISVRATKPVVSARPQANAASAALAEEARAKAKERIRQRMLQQQKTAAGGGKTSQPTQTSTAKEGMARARERVRQKQLQQKDAAEKENCVRKTATSTRLSSGRSHVTVPHGPKFATDAKYGEKQIPRKDAPTLAQSGDVMRRGLRGEDKAPYTRSGRPTLTIPQAPKFATNARFGDKGSAKRDVLSLAESSDHYEKHLRDDMTVGSVSSIGSHSHSLTIPRAPKFTTTARFGERPVTPGRAGSSDKSLASSSHFFGKALRDGKSPAPTVKREGPTIPRSPRFHSSVKTRELPLSTEEKEKEMMEYYASHPFKAGPVVTHAAAVRRLPVKPNKRRMTAPGPLHFRSNGRSESTSGQDKDSQEMPKQFHARPMPTFSQPVKRPTARATAATKTTTTPKPFSLSSERKVRTDPRVVATPNDVELTRKFQARPVPKSTYVPPISQATSPRTPASARRSAQAAVQQRELRKAENKSPSPPAKPFVLQSSLRHEAYQKQRAEKLAQEEAQRREQMSFTARSFKKSPTPPERIRTDMDREPTEPCPFQLSGVARHAAFGQEQHEKLAAEEEERRRQADFKAKPFPKSTYATKPLSPKQMDLAARQAVMEQSKRERLAAEEEEYRQQANFKAKPVPKSTYAYKPISPQEKELVQPFSPLLQSKQRAEDRKEYDAKAYRQRMLELATTRANQDRIDAEEQADLDERRRMPVSEGGMIPTAAPVGAIFFTKD